MTSAVQEPAVAAAPGAGGLLGQYALWLLGGLLVGKLLQALF